MTSSKQIFHELYKVAHKQDGYFTAHQARMVGYSKQSISYHLKTGDWDQEWRGIYRLAYFPRPDYPDLMTLYLWSCNSAGIPQGVISHDKALDLYNMGTWTRQANTMTVPPGFRKQTEPPGKWKHMHLYYAKLNPGDVHMVHKVPVTTPLKTVVDLLEAGHVPEHHLWDAMDAALQQNLITHEEMVQVDLTRKQRELLVQLLKDICYGRGLDRI